LNSINASELSAKLILKGKKVNGLDIMIAAQAIAENACLLTKDSDFKVMQRVVPELVLDR
jgi:predicted nucleic acid-binding protein